MRKPTKASNGVISERKNFFAMAPDMPKLFSMALSDYFALCG
jgi:hypothetical protein